MTKQKGRIKAAEWLRKKIEKHGNTFFWPTELKAQLDKKIAKYGNTYLRFGAWTLMRLWMPPVSA